MSEAVGNRILCGAVTSGFGLATKDGAGTINVLRRESGLATLRPGTLNVQLDSEYLWHPFVILRPDEWNGSDSAALAHCRVAGLRCVLYKPCADRPIPGWKQSGLDVLEIMSECHLRSTLGLVDGSTIEVEVEAEGDEGRWVAD